MDQQTLLRNTVAEFFETDPSAMTPDFPLGGKRLSGSLARATLDAAIRRRLGVKSSAVYSAKYFGELESAILGTPMSDGSNGHSASAPVSPSSLPRLNMQTGGGSCGVDIECVDNLPSANDPWEDPFYKQTFAPAEIAYCITQDNPNQHFAARWAAKEALKKCDAAFLTEEMSDIEVVVDASGAPSLHIHRGDDSMKLPHAVSMSHTPDMAVAVVVHNSMTVSTTQTDAPVERVKAPVERVKSVSREIKHSEMSREAGGASGTRFVPMVIAIVALVLATWSLVRSF